MKRGSVAGNEYLLRFGNRLFALARFRMTRRDGDVLKFYFDEPREIHAVRGAAAIEAAIEELQYVSDQAQTERDIAEGWQDLV